MSINFTDETLEENNNYYHDEWVPGNNNDIIIELTGKYKIFNSNSKQNKNIKNNKNGEDKKNKKNAKNEINKKTIINLDDDILKENFFYVYENFDLIFNEEQKKILKNNNIIKKIVPNETDCKTLSSISFIIMLIAYNICRD